MDPHNNSSPAQLNKGGGIIAVWIMYGVSPWWVKFRFFKKFTKVLKILKLRRFNGLPFRKIFTVAAVNKKLVDILQKEHTGLSGFSDQS